MKQFKDTELMNIKHVTDTWAYIPDFDYDSVRNEVWKVDLFSNQYEASNLGRIRFRSSHKLVKQCLNQCGYMCCGIRYSDGRQRIISVHTVVLEAFTCLTSDRSLRTCDHKDCNVMNNQLSNLEWVTPKENMRRARENKLTCYQSKPILCVTDNKYFESISEAGQFYHTDSGNLHACLRFGVDFRGKKFKFI